MPLRLSGIGVVPPDGVGDRPRPADHRLRPARVRRLQPAAGPYRGRLRATDVRAVCTALGIERLVTWGISGGGPHVLATAALLPDLVAAAASLASLAPYDADGLDWFDGMGQENVDDFKLAVADHQAARAKCEEQRAGVLAASADTLAATMPSLLTPTDAAVFTGELAAYLDWSGREGLGPSAEGLFDDGLAFAGAWGFDPATIPGPLLIMQGREDKFVPFGHGQWLAARIPGAEAACSTTTATSPCCRTASVRSTPGWPPT